MKIYKLEISGKKIETTERFFVSNSAAYHDFDTELHNALYNNNSQSRQIIYSTDGREFQLLEECENLEESNVIISLKLSECELQLK